MNKNDSVRDFGRMILSHLSHCCNSPSSTFNTSLLALAAFTVSAKLLQCATVDTVVGAHKTEKSATIKSLRLRFLAVFWSLRCSDWLQGPYFYEVYASKIINGTPASFRLVSQLFLTGFASTALFGAAVGRAIDQHGRKQATIAFSLIHTAGALSTKSLQLKILFAGRVLSGIGTSLLFSAPESWLVAEAHRQDPDGRYLDETFGIAYAGDSIVAIAAGQMATVVATQRGPVGPFELSSLFLLFGGLLAALLWDENKATCTQNETISVQENIRLIQKDPKIMLLGSVQSLFEAAMYIFVMQWPPAITGAVQNTFAEPDVVTPYGTIFSCFMVCCLLGSMLFGHLTMSEADPETFTAAFLTVATISMSTAAWTVKQSATSLPLLATAFFAFEVCVGMYFPSIGTLRSHYIPDSHRSVIVNLFGIPLNFLVVSVCLSIQKLGVSGSLSVSAAALGLATLCMFHLRRIVREKD